MRTRRSMTVAGEQYQRQDAQEHIFVVAVKELEYCHGEHQHAQHHIDRE